MTPQAREIGWRKSVAPGSARWRTVRGWLWRAAAAVVTILVVAAIAAGLTRWPITQDEFRARVIASIERQSGLIVRSAGPMRMRLLPRPGIEIADVSMRGPADLVTLDADDVRGWPSFSLLWGEPLRFAGVALTSPTIVLDVDRLAPIFQAAEAGGTVASLLHTAGLKLTGGVIRLHSSDRHRDMLLTDVTGAFRWPAGGSEASVSGTATWRGVTVELSGDVDGPERLLTGGQALASLHLKSTLLNLDATGTLVGAGDVRAAGRLNASTPDLPGFLRTIGTPAPQVGGIAEARLAAGVTLTADTLSLADAALNLDDMVFDGALAVHRRGERASLAGTLATDRLELDRFLKPLPSPFAPGGGWSGEALDTRAIAFDDIDLRVSASVATLGPFTIEDGGLSLQSGEGRLEFSLGEARAYDGLLKGRVVATLDGQDTDVRAEATLSRMDVGALLHDAPGHFDVAGTMTGHVSLDAKGTSIATLMDSVTGRGEVSVRNGRVGSRAASAVVTASPNLTGAGVGIGGETPFDAATLSATIEAGWARLGNASITWPSAGATLSGLVSLRDQRLDLAAVVNATDEPASAASRFVLKGPWRAMRLKPGPPPS